MELAINFGRVDGTVRLLLSYLVHWSDAPDRTNATRPSISLFFAVSHVKLRKKICRRRTAAADKCRVTLYQKSKNPRSAHARWFCPWLLGGYALYLPYILQVAAFQNSARERY